MSRFLISAIAGLALVGCGQNPHEIETRGAQRDQAPTLSVTTELVDPAGLDSVELEGELEEPALAELEVVQEGELEAPETFEIQVRSGESLVMLAGWAELTVEDLLEVNAIDPAAGLRVGQAIAIPLPEEMAPGFEDSRQAWQTARLDRYMARRGGLVGLDTYVVRTGDVAWKLADANDLPMWVFTAFNREADLDRLRIGDRLTLPVLGDSVDIVSDQGAAEVDEPTER